MGLEFAGSITYTLLRAALPLAAGGGLVSDSCTSLHGQEFIGECCEWEIGAYALLGFWSFTGVASH